jgi:hypothetical protein
MGRPATHTIGSVFTNRSTGNLKRRENSNDYQTGVFSWSQTTRICCPHSPVMSVTAFFLRRRPNRSNEALAPQSFALDYTRLLLSLCQDCDAPPSLSVTFRLFSALSLHIGLSPHPGYPTPSRAGRRRSPQKRCSGSLR